MNPITALLESCLHSGLSKHKDPEAQRMAYMVNLFSMVGMGITAAIAVAMAIRYEWWLAIPNTIASLVYFLGHYYHRRTGDFAVSSNIIQYSLMAFTLYLVQSGGLNNTGPLWIYIVAPVALFFGGLNRGLLNIGIFTLLVSIILFYPGDSLLSTGYSLEFKTRLLYSFLTLTFLAGYYEYSRQRSFQAMLDSSHRYERMAKLDPLTQLSNRRDTADKLYREDHRMLRDGSTIALLMADIDHFKKINDQYGHDSGDKVLVSLAKLFNDNIRAHDTVSRWGGEEFLFVLPHTNAPQAHIVAQKLIEKLHQHKIELSGDPIKITISIGISVLTPEHPDIDQAIKLADNNLYQAKANGRDGIWPRKVSAG